MTSSVYWRRRLPTSANNTLPIDKVGLRRLNDTPMRQRGGMACGAAGLRGHVARSAAALLFAVLPAVHVALHEAHGPAPRNVPLPAVSAAADEARADEQDCPICELSAENPLDLSAVGLLTPPTTRRVGDIPRDDAVSSMSDDAPAAARAPPHGSNLFPQSHPTVA